MAHINPICDGPASLSVPQIVVVPPPPPPEPEPEPDPVPWCPGGGACCESDGNVCTRCAVPPRRCE
jgi:hypothetical protein